MTRTVPALAALLLVSSLVTGCSLLGDDAVPTAGTTRWDPSVSLTAAGEDLARSAGLGADAPTYDVEADVDPGTGEVSGTVRGAFPVGEAGELLLRYFAGVPDFEADARLGDVTVDGSSVEARRDDALVTVPLPDGHTARVRGDGPVLVHLAADRAGWWAAGCARGHGRPCRHRPARPARRDALISVTGSRCGSPRATAPTPTRPAFGDIGNSPAALIRLTLTVPERWQVVDGGVRTEDAADNGPARSRRGDGMQRHLVVSVVRGFVTRERTLRATWPGSRSGSAARAPASRRSTPVLDEAATSLEVLSDAFVDIPANKSNVVASLGSGVAGMEWPGATWIEPSLFVGGIPGLSGLEDLLGGVEEL